MGRGVMTKIRLAWVHAYRDRHGKARYYFRRPGVKKVPLPGAPGSDAFMEAYKAALSGDTPKRQIGSDRATPGTIHAAVSAYLASPTFAVMAPETRRTRRNILERFRIDHGEKRVALLQRSHIERMVAAKAATPSSCRNFLNTLRAMLDFCVMTGQRADNPAVGVKRPPIKTTGYRTWEEDDIKRFEARHPVGTRARLALSLLLHTAQRRGDIVKMGRQHIQGDTLKIRQGKTGTLVEVPITPAFRAIIAATPSDHLTFLTTRQGKPFTPAGFTNWFREACNQAGLPKGTSAHGLRKGACRRLAEAGCSANEIAAISGHISLREVQRYTLAADRRRMAKAASKLVEKAFPGVGKGTGRG